MQDVLLSKDHHILKLQFNRPDRKNALTQSMYQQLADALQSARNDDDIHAVLLTGGPDQFTGGNDISDFVKQSNYESALGDLPVAHFIEQLSTLTKPVVAEVNGPAVGIGMTMLFHCDLVYAGPTAYFIAPFVQLGLCSEFAASQTFSAVMGRQKAMRLLLLGDKVDAQQAYELGFVTEVVKDTATKVTDVLRTLARLSPTSLQTTKQLMLDGASQSTQQLIQAELTAFESLLRSPETQKAMQAFFKKD